MSKMTKIWLVIAASLVVLGLTVFTVVMARYNWDFTLLSTIKYQTKAYDISDDFKDISVNTKTADILLVPSEDRKCRVVCYEQTNAEHIVQAKDGRLTVNISDQRKWYEYIGINFENPKITLYIPKGEYNALAIKGDTGDVKIPNAFKFKSIDVSVSTGDVTNYASALGDINIKTSTGDIFAENISSGNFDFSVLTGTVIASKINCNAKAEIKVSTGKAELTDINCKNLVSIGNTGDIFLKNVIAEDTLSIERSTGDMIFDGLDAGEILVKTDTGNVKGSLLSDKVFITKTDTGRVSVPKTVTGGRCEITTDTGDIDIKIK